MACEMCGSSQPLFKAKIEGGILSVCKECASYGEIISKPTIAEPTKKKEMKTFIKKEKILLITPEYAELIKKKREQMGLKQEELALKIAEKESLVHKIESAHMEPSIDIARKFERYLGIKLIEEVESDSPEIAKKESSEELTIGDMIKVKKR